MPRLLPHPLSGALCALGLLALSPGCGGGGATGGSSAPAAFVTVAPAYARLAPGDDQDFTAQVTGAPDPTVTWSVVGGDGNGTVSAGRYHAPATGGVFAVRASLASAPGTFGEAVVDVGVPPAPGSCGAPDLGSGADLRGYRPFPADSAWNQDISGLPVASDSAGIIGFIGASRGLKGDFGSGLYEGQPIGIPYIVVAGSQARVPVTFTAYGDESDPGPMPVPAAAPIEGGPSSSGDRHVLVLDRDSCVLYELGNAYPQAGSWRASGAAIWDLRSSDLRPWGWTSADAAGLPILPGLVRYDEVAAGAIDHALRFTVPGTRRAYLEPASHWAPSSSAAYAPPMGLRVRLKASVDLGGFAPRVQVILRALKRYGMILADNGSAWYLSGAPDDRWDNDELQQLGRIKGSDLEVVATGTPHTAHPTGSAPAIASLTASPGHVPAGGSSTLSWSATGATRFFVTPDPGLVRGTAATVSPAATTTYTLTAQGPFGSATRTVTVTVP